MSVRPGDQNPARGANPSYGSRTHVSSRSRDKSANYADRHRDRAAERAAQGRCVNPARGIRWLMTDGALEPVRCGASNRCDYCAMFAALEAALVLKLDAQLEQPTVGITTTTRRPGVSLGELRRAEEYLWRSLRTGRQIGARGPRRRDERRFPAFEQLRYCGFLEWTAGDGTHAGGNRRPHLHHLTKGIPAGDPLLNTIPLEDVPADHPFVRERHVNPGETTTPLELRVSELWHTITGDAFMVEARPLRTPAGAIAYLALHHHKRRQAPPPGFAGRRLRPSRGSDKRPGYYAEPIADLRRLAQKLAAHERVTIAAKRAIGIELYGDEPPAEWETDAALTHALVEALRSLADSPPPLQLSLDGYTDEQRAAERRELVERTVAELERIRHEDAPVLVRVTERELVDTETGTVTRRALAVLGALEPRQPNVERRAA